ncbi:MAG: 6-phosphogluconolactonase [Pyrinomonadaceae bacterium]
MKDQQIIVCEDNESLAHWAARRFVYSAAQAIKRAGRFTVALAGGSTPRSLYALLATPSWSAEVAWDKVHLFWGDERHVPPDTQESNYRMAHETLIRCVPIPADNVHRVISEEERAESAAEKYEQELRAFFELGVGDLPRFDLILLGLGPDGHTASLFPGTEVLDETTRLVAAPWVPKFSAYRITLTLPVLNNAIEIMFLVSGREKAAKVREVTQETASLALPAQLVRPRDGELLWVIDRAAASELPGDAAVTSA